MASKSSKADPTCKPLGDPSCKLGRRGPGAGFLQRGPELKYTKQYNALVPVSGAGVPALWQPLAGIAAGAGADQRIGREITLVRARFTAHHTPTVSTTNVVSEAVVWAADTASTAAQLFPVSTNNLARVDPLLSVPVTEVIGIPSVFNNGTGAVGVSVSEWAGRVRVRYTAAGVELDRALSYLVCWNASSCVTNVIAELWFTDA